jgi:thiamine-phosphate pyrophosphorylase
MELQPLRPSNLIRVMPAKEVRSDVLPRIHCITDFPSYGAQTIALLEAVVREGVDAVQVRAKSVPDQEVVAFTRALVDRLAGTPARVIVNDRLDIALAAGAHGVHLGQHDLPVVEARRLAPQGFLVGGTCRTAEHAEEAKAQGADYVGVGPVYPTTTKSGLPDPIGLDALRDAARVLPAIAISGINAERTAEVMAAGAYGIAVASAICRSSEPALAARRLVDAVALP